MTQHMYNDTMQNYQSVPSGARTNQHDHWYSLIITLAGIITLLCSQCTYAYCPASTCRTCGGAVGYSVISNSNPGVQLSIRSDMLGPINCIDLEAVPSSTCPARGTIEPTSIVKSGPSGGVYYALATLPYLDPQCSYKVNIITTQMSYPCCAPAAMYAPILPTTIPTITSYTVNAWEDATRTFTADNFISNYHDDYVLVKVQILTLPENGTLELSGVPVIANQEIPIDKLDHLTFTPSTNWSGYTSFSWNGSNGIHYASTSANVEINVSPLQSIIIDPSNATMVKGLSYQFIALGTYSDGTNQTIASPCNWTSSDTNVATINTAGIAQALNIGTTNINATPSGIVSQVPTTPATLTVTEPVLQTILVTPTAINLVNGTTAQCSATGIYNDGSSRDITSLVTWQSSDTGVASINSAGLATASMVGTSTITATLSGITSQPGHSTIITVLNSGGGTTLTCVNGYSSPGYGVTYPALTGVKYGISCTQGYCTINADGHWGHGASVHDYQADIPIRYTTCTTRVVACECATNDALRTFNYMAVGGCTGCAHSFTGIPGKLQKLMISELSLPSAYTNAAYYLCDNATPPPAIGQTYYCPAGTNMTMKLDSSNWATSNVGVVEGKLDQIEAAGCTVVDRQDNSQGTFDYFMNGLEQAKMCNHTFGNHLPTDVTSIVELEAINGYNWYYSCGNDVRKSISRSNSNNCPPGIPLTVIVDPSGWSPTATGRFRGNVTTVTLPPIPQAASYGWIAGPVVGGAALVGGAIATGVCLYMKYHNAAHGSPPKIPMTVNPLAARV